MSFLFISNAGKLVGAVVFLLAGPVSEEQCVCFDKSHLTFNFKFKVSHDVFKKNKKIKNESNVN